MNGNEGKILTAHIIGIMRKSKNTPDEYKEKDLRRVLAKWLSWKEIKSYEEAIAIAETIIKIRKETLQRFLSEGLVSGPAFENWIKIPKRLIREIQFIRHLLDTEREFIEEFLSSR